MCSEAGFSNKIKIKSMDLDNHLLAISTMCGPVSDFKAASNLIKDKLDPSQVTLTCNNWTGKLWLERYKNLKTLVNQNIVRFPNENTQ